MAEEIIFDGLDASGLYGLWVSNGTASGTYELNGISGANSGGLEPYGLTLFGSDALFEGSDAAGNSGLWITNGTTGGTYELNGIAGANSSGVAPYDLTVFNGEVLFNGYDTAGNYGLWVTNGTAAGTSELTGISGANPNGLDPYDLTVYGNDVLFGGEDASGNYGLWVTNGTAGGTQEITVSNALGTGVFADIYFPDFTLFNGVVFFQGEDAAGNYGLWETNGTSAGTFELTGISGANSGGVLNVSTPDFTVFNGEMLFQGSDTNGNSGLWVTNGTTAGTSELNVVGANAGGIFSNVNTPDFTVFGNLVLFEGEDASGNDGLWVTNGTAGGTFELTGISGALSSGIFSGVSYPYFTVFGNEVLFQGEDANGDVGLWETNGTSAGTHEITGIGNVYVTSVVASDLTVLGSEVLFNGEDSSGNFDLWVTDGTLANTFDLTGVTGASSSGLAPAGLTDFGGEALFQGFGTDGEYGLWVTNGTTAGTQELTGITGASSNGILDINSAYVDFTVFNAGSVTEAIFAGLDSTGDIGLWVTNGTASGTQELSVTGAADSIIDLPPDFTLFGSEILFAGEDSSNVNGLWETNGTGSGTHELTVTGAASTGVAPSDLTVFGSEVLFAGTDASNGIGLWETNGTTTTEIAGTSGVDPSDMTVLGTDVLFDSVGDNLWIMPQGGTPSEITGISGAYAGGLFDVAASDMTVFDGKVLFDGADASGHDGLWVTNGTAGGTFELTGISGAASSGLFGQLTSGINPDFTVFDGEVLFDAYSSNSTTMGLWETNGTAAGTVELTSSFLSPSYLTALDTTVAAFDFAGSGTSDILWQNTTSNQLAIWQIHDGIPSAYTSIGTAPSGWQPVAAADFFDSGATSILWENLTSDEAAIWQMNGTTPIGYFSIGTFPSGWEIVGTGDFYGNGYADILWRNPSTTQISIWQMDGASVVSYNLIGSAPSQWKVAGVADFAGTSDADILWQNTSTNQVAIWEMHGSSVAAYNTIGTAPSGWQIAGIGDFVGNGSQSILWENTSTDQLAIWETNGVTLTGSAVVANGVPFGSGWQIAAIGDYYGTGADDILWQNKNAGEIAVWQLNGLSAATYGPVTSGIPSGWQPAHNPVLAG